MTGHMEVRSGRRRDEAGGASVLVAGLMGVVLLLSYVVLLLAGYALAHHRARAAADLVALSAAGAVSRGQDGCRQARRSASDNGARLLSCDQVGDQLGFVVTVRVAVPTPSQVVGLPREVQAEADAGPVG